MTCPPSTSMALVCADSTRSFRLRMDWASKLNDPSISFSCSHVRRRPLSIRACTTTSVSMFRKLWLTLTPCRFILTALTLGFGAQPLVCGVDTCRHGHTRTVKAWHRHTVSAWCRRTVSAWHRHTSAWHRHAVSAWCRHTVSAWHRRAVSVDSAWWLGQ